MQEPDHYVSPAESKAMRYDALWGGLGFASILVLCLHGCGLL